MSPVNTMSAACAWSSQPTWDGACSAQPTHLPGLISQAQPGLPPLMPLCFLHSSCSWINPRPISQTIKIAPTSHACQGSQICFVNVQGFYFIFGIFSVDITAEEGMGV